MLGLPGCEKVKLGGSGLQIELGGDQERGLNSRSSHTPDNRWCTNYSMLFGTRQEMQAGAHSWRKWAVGEMELLQPFSVLALTAPTKSS